jgi:hypothetical protein
MSLDRSSSWNVFRRRQLVAGAWLVIGLPVAVGIAIALKRFPWATVELTLLPLILLWAAVWLVLCLRVTRFPCPGCGAPFLAGQEPVWSSTRHCTSCGLQLNR